MSLSDELAVESGPGMVKRVADLFKRSGIDPEEVKQVNKVRLYQGFYKDDEGNAHTVDMQALEVVPGWVDGPQWPVVQPGPVVKVPVNKVKPQATGWPICVVLPDMQIGYYRSAGDELEPTHDEAAIAAALGVIRAARPAQVVMVGDNADLPELSKYRLSPAYARTTQATIDRCTTLCAEVRAAAPDAEIVWLAGNHEERLPFYLLDNAKAAFGLKKGNAPDSWPVLSMPYLCRMDDYKVDYRPGYPASHHWITPRLKVIHGDKHTSTGSTAHKYLNSEKTSVIYGHVHRREAAFKTRQDHDGPKEIMAASPGCLARIDGAVPSTKGGIDLDGRPVVRYEDWQTGIAVVEYDPETGFFDYQNLAIITA